MAPTPAIVLGTNVQSLSGIREALLVELAGNQAKLRFINTRLILSIGVNLFAISPAEDQNIVRAKLALETLNQMGFLQKKTEVPRGK